MECCILPTFNSVKTEPFQDELLVNSWGKLNTWENTTALFNIKGNLRILLTGNSDTRPCAEISNGYTVKLLNHVEAINVWPCKGLITITKCTIYNGVVDARVI